MPELDLDAIEARAEAAIEGPWRMWDGWGPTSDGLMGFARLGPETGEQVFIHDERRYLFATRADAEFIAAARTDVPALVAEVRRLRDTVQRVRALVADVDTWTPYDSRDTGATFLAESVRDLLDDIRAALDGQHPEEPSEPDTTYLTEES